MNFLNLCRSYGANSRFWVLQLLIKFEPMLLSWLCGLVLCVVYLHTIGNKQIMCHNFTGLHLKEMSSGHESVTDKRMDGGTYRKN